MSRKPNIIKTARGECMERLPDGSVLHWGWTFRKHHGVASRVRRASPVTVFAVVAQPTTLLFPVQPHKLLVPHTVVGAAQRAADAARIGRAAVRERVEPAVDAYRAKLAEGMAELIESKLAG